MLTTGVSPQPISPEPNKPNAGTVTAPAFSCPCCRPGGALEGRLPLDPHRPPLGSRCTPFRQPGARHGAPTAVESAHNARPRGGTEAARPPAAPSAAGCAGSATAVAAASTADGPRGARPRARAPTRPHTLRRRGGRAPSRARTEPRTNPRAGRGGWWRLPCRPLTAGALPRRLCASAQATRGGVVRGTRKGRCRRRADRRSDHGQEGCRCDLR